MMPDSHGWEQEASVSPHLTSPEGCLHILVAWQLSHETSQGQHRRKPQGLVSLGLGSHTSLLLLILPLGASPKCTPLFPGGEGMHSPPLKSEGCRLCHSATTVVNSCSWVCATAPQGMTLNLSDLLKVPQVAKGKVGIGCQTAWFPFPHSQPRPDLTGPGGLHQAECSEEFLKVPGGHGHHPLWFGEHPDASRRVQKR